MARGIWRKEGKVAVPVGAASIQYFEALKDGEEFMAETKGARNLKQLKLWWSLCALVAESGHVYDTREKASTGLKYACHHVDTFMEADGRLRISPKSIAFESLAQEDFDPIFREAVNKVLEWLGTAPKDLADKFFEMTADKRWSDTIRKLESRYGAKAP